MGYFCGLSTIDDVGCWLGNIGAFAFFFVEFPQIVLNFKRKSTEGFSSLSVLIRFFGIAFQISFGILGTLQKSAFLAACLLALESAVFIIQFAIYRKNKLYFLGFLLPVPGIVLTFAYPQSISVTKWFYSATQVICYFPYIITLISHGSTLGISLFGQHLNFLGAICGILMCCLTVESDIVTWFFYIFSFLQAVSVFLLAMSYDEYRIFDQNHLGSKHKDVIKLTTIP